MTVRGFSFAASLAALSLASGAAAAGDKDAPPPRPLPVEKTQKLMKEGSVYTVTGRVRIPKGVEITVLRNSVIRGEGSTPAVIEVEGGLDCIGVFGREVILENVVVEPQKKFERVRMDMAFFRGSGGIRSPKDTAVDGYFLLENFDLTGGTDLDVLQCAGSFELSSACSDAEIRYRTTLPEGRDKGSVRVFIRGCHQEPRHSCTPHGGRVGLVGGLVLDGGEDVTVQLSRIGGARCSLRNWGAKAIFDGNKVNAQLLEFSQDKPGMYQRLQCAKLDVYAPVVTAFAPPAPNMKDTFLMDRCYFSGITDPKQVLEKVIKDGADDPEKNGARVTLNKVGDRPLELAGERQK
jgi:hypothetical protein